MARPSVNTLAFAQSNGAGAAPPPGLLGGLPDPVAGRGGSGGACQLAGQLVGSPCRLLPAGGRSQCPPR